MRDKPHYRCYLRPFLILALLLPLVTTDPNISDSCNYKMFPIFAGGSGYEDVRALELDPSSNWIYVGG